jgi:hypothetical protein
VPEAHSSCRLMPISRHIRSGQHSPGQCTISGPPVPPPVSETRPPPNGTDGTDHPAGRGRASVSWAAISRSLPRARQHRRAPRAVQADAILRRAGRSRACLGQTGRPAARTAPLAAMASSPARGWPGRSSRTRPLSAGRPQTVGPAGKSDGSARHFRSLGAASWSRTLTGSANCGVAGCRIVHTGTDRPK